MKQPSNSTFTQKYNVPGPRYTSYPTVPYWDTDQFTKIGWVKSVKNADTKKGISVYIHLPYCESLCTFCGCNKRITKNHDVERPYIDAILKEWQLYQQVLDTKPIIQEIHLGGGTPTFFTPEHLTSLINGILENAELAPNIDLSFEGHPNNTTEEHLQALYDLGFRRVSYGIQCFDPAVQDAINRKQTYEQVQKVVAISRAIGYTSVNFDVIYGLPFQTETAVKATFTKVVSLKPDRIAYYSYAHVPWIKGNGQRKFTEKDLPRGDMKLDQYIKGEELLLEAGYCQIGMDHFALKGEALQKSAEKGQLHRNFMGYTTRRTDLMIGLGVSAISDSWSAFAQNHKTVEAYMESIKLGELPVFRGHLLSEEDETIRQHILELMCQYATMLPTNIDLRIAVLSRLQLLENDGFVEIINDKIIVTKLGKSFLRNICMTFDAKLWENQPNTQLFSMTI
jgi:oxygen-independent coproporphyrinogen-3 oxidase